MTDAEPESLIQRSERQMTLLDVAPEFREELERKGEFTGERLHAADPEKYRAIVAALAEGMGLRAISRAYRVSVNSVRAIKVRETGPIDTEKKEISLRLRQFVAMASDRLVEEVDEIPVDKLPLATAIVIDKIQLLDGEATSISGSVSRPVATPEQWADLVGAIGRVVDGPETGLESAENLQSEGLPALPGAADLEPLEAAVTDGQSVVSGPESPN